MEDVIGNYGGRLLLAVAGVGLALAGFTWALRFLRNRGAASFLTGKRGRDARLQILDTTAVDARRRLVLVRRDNVEHLIMIGGPTDVVIESRIVSGHDSDDDSGHRNFQSYSYAAPAYETEGVHGGDFDAGDDEHPPSPDIEEPRSTGLAERWRRKADAVWANVERVRVATPFSPSAAPDTADRSPMGFPPAAHQPVPARTGAGHMPSKVEAVKEQMDDFEKMLQAEMASRQQPGRPAASQIVGRPPSGAGAAARPPASEQRAMQEQMARIFGDDH